MLQPERYTPESERYSTVAITLHWLIAAALAFQFVLGWAMGGGLDSGRYALFQLHKSVGITILLLSLIRLGWRIGHRAPPPPRGQPAWQTGAAHLVHAGLYLIMIGLPLTGWLLVSTSRISLETVLYGTIPWPHMPGTAGLAPATRSGLEAFGHNSHGALVWIGVLLFLLHVGAAAKHQIIDRDRVLAHMAPGARPGIGEPRLWAALGGFAAVLCAGLLYANATIGARKPAAASTLVADAGNEAEPELPPTGDEPANAVGNTTDGKAAGATPASADPKTAAAPMPVRTWAVQKEKSTLGFTTAWSGDAIHGKFTSWKADIRFSPDDLAGSSIEITVDVTSARTGDDQRDSSLPGPEFFDSAAHPAAVFKATRIRRTGEDRFQADGTLSIRGVSKNISLPFRLKIDGNRASASGTVTIDRTTFGVGQGEFASTDSIPAQVKVSFSLSASAN